jgi:hypothetical protein
VAILIVWVGIAFLVAIAAGARDRSSVGWFFLAVIISPVLALIALLVLPNLRHEAILEKIAANQQRPEPQPLPSGGWGRKVTRVTVDRTPRPFEPDGVYSGVPYRVGSDGSIDAIMHGATVKFRNFDKFVGMVGSSQPHP